SKGVMTATNDDNDVFDSGNECDHWTCSNGVLSSKPMASLPCTITGTVMGFCEKNPDPSNPGLFLCSECDTSTNCAGVPGTTCVQGRCLKSHCTNGSKDFGETDKDCGGPDCLPCSTGKVCASYTDCFSQICTANLCVAPSCTDNKQNGTETDQDCGGNCS